MVWHRGSSPIGAYQRMSHEVMRARARSARLVKSASVQLHTSFTPLSESFVTSKDLLSVSQLEPILLSLRL